MLNQEKVQEFAKLVSYHYTIVKNRAYLDEFIDGLRSLGIVQLIKVHPGMYNW